MNWFTLTVEEQQIILRRVAITTGISEAAIEKDIYVCWCLQQLFSLPEGSPSLVFKGGTSLSKVFGAIRRFSEDIDITLNQRFFLGDTDVLLPGLSKKKIRDILEQLDAAVDRFAVETLAPLLQERCAALSGQWSVERGRFQTVLVRYPTVTDDDPYLSKEVAIEPGARNVLEPLETHPICPYAAEHFPMLSFPESPAASVLSPVRTFWEKATILHAEYHRPEPRAAERIARHWYDTAMLAQHSIKERALADLEMLEMVANYKDRIYPSGWASYATARAKTLRIVPHAALHDLLKADYDDMVRAGFFFSTPLTWEEIVAVLQRLEQEINQ